MKEKLFNLLRNSYSPYSHFRVAAIVRMKDGKEFTGVNVENASYGATICAVRCAILKAVSEGYKKEDFLELYIMCDHEKTSSCCFLCRQVIVEFMDPECKIVFMSNDGKEEQHFVKEVCPYPFSKEDLK